MPERNLKGPCLSITGEIDAFASHEIPQKFPCLHYYSTALDEHDAHLITFSPGTTHSRLEELNDYRVNVFYETV